MGKKKDLIDALRAKTGMSHAAAKRVVERQGKRPEKQIEPVIEKVIELGQARAEFEEQHTAAGDESIGQIMNRIIELGQARADYNEERIEKRIRETGSPLISMADAVAERRANGWKRHPTYEALVSYLRAQPREVLLKVITVMYAGRDDEDPIDVYRMFWHEKPFALASQIASKSPVADYLRDGLRVVARERLSLDDDWEPLARERARREREAR